MTIFEAYLNTMSAFRINFFPDMEVELQAPGGTISKANSEYIRRYRFRVKAIDLLLLP